MHSTHIFISLKKKKKTHLFINKYGVHYNLIQYFSMYVEVIRLSHLFCLYPLREAKVC